ncbi:snaclec B2-like [Sander lucioperca]|uniref:snaclec B2-like n=1 Tax=Sander lucioperca TaxID=283035 RepID=UPI0016535EEE|nr:snaclec B2-like [Sander lucioperca]
MMTKSSGPFLLLLLLLSLSSTASGLGSVVQRDYSYISKHYTWQDAQSYCKKSPSYTDLASIFTQSDADSINMGPYHAWISLHKLNGPFWIWSNKYGMNVNFGQSQYHWGYNEPRNENCALIYYTSQK